MQSQICGLLEPDKSFGKLRHPNQAYSRIEPSGGGFGTQLACALEMDQGGGRAPSMLQFSKAHFDECLRVILICDELDDRREFSGGFHREHS
ncbi:MAG TPA: hypothetical protein VMR02_12430 [Terracidiphilus sp.]|jgi:hypothetical protein|nr:hypothetical protein [Terracidiphilus sp.]